MTIQNGSDELLAYLISQQNSGVKDWFGYRQQRITGIYLAYEIAKNHANVLTAEQCAEYAVNLNNAIYDKLIPENKRNPNG
jgi:hypothetical protein